MPENCAVSSNLCPAFSMQNTHEGRSEVSLGHFKINWHRTHVFSQTALLLAGVAFAFFMKVPLLLIGIAGYANVQMMLHFAMEKRKYFPLFNQISITWNRLQFFSHTTFILAGVAFAFFMQLTPVMLGLTAYGIAQTILYAKEETNFNIPWLNRLNIKWHKVQFGANIFLFASGIAGAYLLNMPSILLGLGGFAIVHRILHEVEKQSFLAQRIQMDWDKILLVENVAFLLSGIAVAFFSHLPMIMLVISGYGVLQMIVVHLAHRNEVKDISYQVVSDVKEKRNSSKEKKNFSLSRQIQDLRHDLHSLKLTQQKKEDHLLKKQYQDEAALRVRIEDLKKEHDSLLEKNRKYQQVKTGIKESLRDLNDKKASAQQDIHILGMKRELLEIKREDVAALERDERELHTEIQRLKYEIQILEIEKDTGKQSIDEKKTQEKKLTEKVAKLKKAQGTLKKKSQEVRTASGEYFDSLENIHEKEAQLEKTNRQVKKLQKSLETLVQASQESQKILETEAQNFAERFAEGLSGMEEKMQAMNLALAEFDTKNEEIQNLREEDVRLRTTIEILEKENAKLESEQKSQIDEIGARKQYHNQLEQGIKKHEQKCENVQSNIESLKENFKNLTEKNNSLKIEINELQEKQEELHAFIEEQKIAQLEFEEKQQLCKEIEERIREQQTRCISYEDKIKKFKEIIEELIEQDTTLQRSTETLLKEHKSLQTEVEHLEMDREKIEKEATLRKELSDSEKLKIYEKFRGNLYKMRQVVDDMQVKEKGSEELRTYNEIKSELRELFKEWDKTDNDPEKQKTLFEKFKIFFNLSTAREGAIEGKEEELKKAQEELAEDTLEKLSSVTSMFTTYLAELPKELKKYQGVIDRIRTYIKELQTDLVNLKDSSPSSRQSSISSSTNSPSDPKNSSVNSNLGTDSGIIPESKRKNSRVDFAFDQYKQGKESKENEGNSSKRGSISVEDVERGMQKLEETISKSSSIKLNVTSQKENANESNTKTQPENIGDQIREVGETPPRGYRFERNTHSRAPIPEEFRQNQ